MANQDTKLSWLQLITNFYKSSMRFSNSQF